ncbi:bZIP transcription factor [Aspergillus ibericus CBS 121593]|uniref:BZIP domain-containing protein n=1 Tax=Aspergillus ibericus CBS 121593 TaxID=1448316 RepID=A0A395H9D3_9EURO|nr:hypothetical protein BO80DRAFT_443096 [Aspergillus ibericus CBS 121593]RAL02844.1 hypothetical protein BO80DRAFT_443096 [Aspergillus ibericus CBS 121593]
MPRPKSKTKSEDLARIRQNQRRSRARRQEYIRSLETLVKEYESTRTTENLLHLSILRNLQFENDLLKLRLVALGGASDFAMPGLEFPSTVPQEVTKVFSSELSVPQPLMSPNLSPGEVTQVGQDSSMLEDIVTLGTDPQPERQICSHEL